MEDRLSPHLVLEFSDLDHDAYRAARGRIGADDELTLWTNQHPHRVDLPRRLPEASLLAVHEVDATADVAPIDGVRSHRFRRTPRPPQGRQTGRPTLGLLIVLVSSKEPERAQELRDWGDFVHLNHIAATSVPGYTTITPYEHADGGQPHFLHLYEMDTAEAEAAYLSMTPLVAERLGGEDTEAFRRWAWHPLLRIDYVNTFRRITEPADA